MPFASLDHLLQGFGTLTESFAPAKYGITNGTVVGYATSSWRMTGSYFPALPPSAPGEACSRNTLGAVPFSGPAAGRAVHLSRFSFSPNQAVGCILADRLYHQAGLSGTVTTAQTVNNGTVTLPARAAGGAGVELWLEWYVTTGATVVNATVSYTNEQGVAGRTATVTSLPASTRGHTMIRVPLQSGDLGVRSVESVTLSASTAAAGNFGVTLLRRIAYLPNATANTVAQLGPIALGLPVIDPAACLFFVIPAASSTTPTFDAELYFVHGPAEL